MIMARANVALPPIMYSLPMNRALNKLPAEHYPTDRCKRDISK